jgi:osmotically-inducible protein OsmY
MMAGGPNPNPMPGDPSAMGSGIPAGGGQFNAGLSAAIVPGPVGSFPAFTGSEIAVGVTAPALLAAVAMRRGQPLGPTNDQEMEDFIYDALDLLPGATDVEVRSEGGRITITGTVPQKRLKRDVGEIAWAMPSVSDVQNNITITARRRSRQGRENEPAAQRKS